MFDERYISPMTEYWGVWNDQQVPETYSHYGDVAMENIADRSKTYYGKRNKIKIN
jgi:hypothetical protein